MASSSSPAERTLRARLAALTRHSRTDGRTATAAARQAFVDRFERDVDPDNVLPITERARRAEAARKAHYTRLALRSVEARRRAKEAREAAPRHDHIASEAESKLRAVERATGGAA